ncbi:acyl-CoA dehydrogenase [Pseudomonas agarici]|uniref:3-sulfinopropanoyl-CoA desulfinase n=1 Tax=Pseudomonas agarici TaxID=46677 RepID=A0A0X1T7E1_PSEAA|nr:acyl-CoA dehydrogenase family protein [Pseudomonas agarici]AMB88054.1 acyl-CoA dehydrogenase [Pseudomonas agarici]NWB92936.1 acyl-CoA/acyl-ACP dehydrogenase [Pseudomonas agarici]NWC09203.1 acyl-CoA/acyl-ACP dehydrogenase [Pseudomonas agarici]SEK31814.1 acyl-CoA dehydrogenase [Pseudomonas agarici]
MDSEDIEMLRATTRRFVRSRLVPLEEAIEIADDVDEALLAQLRSEVAALGLYGFNLPESIGGPGLNAAAKLAILEEMTYTSVPLSEVFGHLPLSLGRCNAQQQDRLLPDLLSGKKILTYALTEPNAGSDLSNLRTRATKTEGGWLLTGSKHFISHAETSDYIIVLAVTDPEASLKSKLTTFIVERRNPGVVGMTRYKKMGWRGYHLNGFSLEDCFVPDADVLGEPGDGFLVMMESINHDRILSACRSTSLAARAHAMSCEYANERTASGTAIANHQAIQLMIADNDVEIEAARLLIQRAAELVEADVPQARIATARAKLYASEMGCRVADRALQIFGGMGYMCELPIERFYRDARAFRIGEGTSEMQRLQIARYALCV